MAVPGIDNLDRPELDLRLFSDLANLGHRPHQNRNDQALRGGIHGGGQGRGIAGVRHRGADRLQTLTAREQQLVFSGSGEVHALSSVP